jgi:hypothetical protein
MFTKPARALLTVALLPLACAMPLAACGSSGKNRTTASRADPLLAVSECMRDHGVTNYPDPSSAGINIKGTGINPNSPAFKSAQAICSKQMPSGAIQTHAREQQIKQATETAECMRNRGVTGFPDPIVTSKPTTFSPSEYSSVQYNNGILIAVPKSINEQSPAYEAAAKACNFTGSWPG